MKGFTLDKLTEIFNSVDADGMGTVDYDEFIVTCITPATLLSKYNLNHLFNYFQPDKNGNLSIVRIVRMISRFNPSGSISKLNWERAF